MVIGSNRGAGGGVRSTRSRWGAYQVLLIALLAWFPLVAQARWPVDSVQVTDPRLQIKAPAPKSAADFPDLDYDIHDDGYLFTVINNNGIIGNVFGYEYRGEHKQAPSFYHPRYSRIQHGYYAALWVGGVVDEDTLVSVAMDVSWNTWDNWYPIEFWPDVYPMGEMERRSNRPSSPYYDPRAKAEMEYTAVFTDTFERQWFVPDNSWDHRSHKPLNIQVRQTSYSWSFKYARDFILVDYVISNLGRKTINDAWIGIYYVGCVHHTGEMPYPPSDDIAGYIYDAPAEFEECASDPLRIAYIRDNDGWAFSFPWDFVRTSSAFGFAPLRMPSEEAINNFNWWTNSWSSPYNWGPRMRGTFDRPFRNFSGWGLGVPYSDKDKYYLMSKPEIDYPGHEADVDHSAQGWLPPHAQGSRIARGHLPEFVTSFGPVTIPPYGSAHFTMVMTIGENVHWDPWAYRDLFDTLNPGPFAEQLDFSDMIDNVRWARRIYDNPGVDTDGDGDSGQYIWYIEPGTNDSTKVFCEGDGVPDFRGAAPPPPPPLRVSAENGRVIIRWNGRQTESFFDPFSLVRDFEGYRVYLSRSQREAEFSLVASYDQPNFSRYRWDQRRRQFRLTELPFTLDSLRALYGPGFDPDAYNNIDPLRVGNDLFYFIKVDFNQSDLTDPKKIHRVYPDARLDTSDVDEEGRMRYYEYEYVIEDLLPTVPYWVAVTAFDFGHPPKDLEALESSPIENMVEVFAADQGDTVLREGQLNVYCYPNPYRIDADYSGNGFEDRTGERWIERARTIWFANLPHRCTISIYSLDGDLVRRIEHDEPQGSGTASREAWDLINRNHQMVVSGLYYWVVESEFGNQIGKVAVVK